MTAHKFSRREVEKVRQEISDLHLVGLPQHEIAERVGVRRQAVAWHLKVIQKRWRTTQVEQFGAARDRLIEELRLSRRELWTAWENSKGERKSTTTRQRKLPGVVADPVSGDDGVIRFPGAGDQSERVEREARVRVEQRDADVHYQVAIVKSIELEAKLRGLLEEAPKLPSESDEPIRRVVVYLERGSDSDNLPLPPGDSPVIDVEPAGPPPPS